MRAYYYIPNAYEQLFAQQVQAWLSAPNNWTVITGHYVTTAETPDYGLVSAVISRNYLGEVEQLPIFVSQEETVKKLAGFILEADLYGISPELHGQLVSLPGVIEQPDSELFLSQLPQ